MVGLVLLPCLTVALINLLYIMFDSRIRYGGTMLGPARFSHIEACTREVCQLFKTLEQVEGCITELESLDQEIVNLRAQLSLLTNTDNSSTTKKQDYKTSLLDPRPDVAKAQRLIRARHGTISSLTKSIQRHSLPDPAET